MGNRMSKDTIYRQDAIDAADKIIDRDTSGNNDVVKAMTAWKEFIKGLPSAEPEIIRCKDCRWRHGSECVRFSDVRPFPDDFCSRAELRGEQK